MTSTQAQADLHLAPVRPGDIDALLPLVRAFYHHFSYPYTEEKKREALRQLIADPALGRVWLVHHHASPVGYVLVAFSFSLEHDGRIAFVDELFIEPEGRQRGAGSAVLREVEAACSALGIPVLRLETEADNERATALYLRSGYVDHGRRLLTKKVPRET